MAGRGGDHVKRTSPKSQIMLSYRAIDNLWFTAPEQSTFFYLVVCKGNSFPSLPMLVHFHSCVNVDHVLQLENN